VHEINVNILIINSEIAVRRESLLCIASIYTESLRKTGLSASLSFFWLTNQLAKWQLTSTGELSSDCCWTHSLHNWRPNGRLPWL